MNHKKYPLILILMLLLAGMTINAKEDPDKKVDEQDLKNHAPSVYLDCRRCDRDYIRTEITYVNYVRTRQDADIHILVTEQRTGSGGREYTMEYIGYREFEGLTNTVTYTTFGTDTRDESRQKMVDGLKKGLFPFLMQTPLADYLSVEFKQKLKPTAVDDKWNFWIFYLSANGRLSGEKSRKYHSIRGNFSASRVTPEWKIRFGLYGNFDESIFDYDDEKIESSSQSRRFTGQVVKSISDHWSIGGWTGWSHSTYSNHDHEFTLAPAIEYNLFPYYESTRRQLRFLYRVGLIYVKYLEETIYDKMIEDLWGQSLAIILEVREPWGNASAEIEGSHYFHDPSKYRVQVEGYLSVRLVRGFSFNIRGEYSRIHDQLSLRKGDATIDEILLRRTELATDFDYSISLGLSFTFGSMYSNVVNPRFGR